MPLNMNSERPSVPREKWRRTLASAHKGRNALAKARFAASGCPSGHQGEAQGGGQHLEREQEHGGAVEGGEALAPRVAWRQRRDAAARCVSFSTSVVRLSLRILAAWFLLPPERSSASSTRRSSRSARAA